MWRCSKCGAEVEDDFEVCWSCSTARSGASYEEFHADIPSAAAPASIAVPEVEQIAVLQAIEDGLGAIARHRVLLLAGVLLLASRLADSFFATPGTPAVEGAKPIARLLPLLRWQAVPWAKHLVVGALVDGFVVAFLYGAACGRASPVEAASRAVSRLPSLVGAEAIVAAIFVAPLVVLQVAVGSHAPPRAALGWCVFALQIYQIYLLVRLIFWREVIVAEAAGLASASRRSWNLVRRNWWRLAFLAAVTRWGAGILLKRLPAYLSVPAGALLGLAADAVMASAYLQRVGLLPRRRPTLTQLVAARAALRSGVLDSS